MTGSLNFPFPPTPVGARAIVDPTELDELFSRHRAAHIYSLCDLEEPYWSHSRWYRRGDATVGIVGNEPGEVLTACAVSTADPDGSSQLLAELAINISCSLVITGATGMAKALATHRPVEWVTSEFRYRLDTPPKQRAADCVVALDESHLDEIESLYASESGAAFFLPSMVQNESFVGVWDDSDSELVAVAGTHLISDAKKVAAIGAVFVRPDYRGRGLGEQVTLGVLDRVSGRVDTIGLNSTRENHVARKIYEGLGFVRILDFEEAKLPSLEFQPPAG